MKDRNKNLNNLRKGNKQKLRHLSSLLFKKVLVTTRFIEEEFLTCIGYLGNLVGLDRKSRFLVLEDVEIYLLRNFKIDKKIGKTKRIAINYGVISTVELVGENEGQD